MFNDLTMSKKILLILIIDFILIQIFTGAATIMMLIIATSTGIIDFTPLVALIGAVIGEVLTYLIYCLKSMKENSMGGLKYEAAMYGLKQNNSDNEEDLYENIATEDEKK